MSTVTVGLWIREKFKKFMSAVHHSPGMYMYLGLSLFRLRPWFTVGVLTSSVIQAYCVIPTCVSHAEFLTTIKKITGLIAFTSNSLHVRTTTITTTRNESLPRTM